MEAIGGYFELELNRIQHTFHSKGLFLNSGHHALMHILTANYPISKIYIPYYTCHIVLDSVKSLGLEYEFYHIDSNLEIESMPGLGANEYIVYTNYFGIKDSYVSDLTEICGRNLIIDNAQALYAQPLRCAGTLYSPRKFVGMPDGGIAYCEKNLESVSYETDHSYDRCKHLLKRIDCGASEGYADFQTDEASLCNLPIRKISKLSKMIFDSIDFEFIRDQRIENFLQLHERLGMYNHLQIPDISSITCPMVYPLLCDNGEDLRKKLISHKIFVATYWPNVLDLCSDTDIEYGLVKNLLPLPIDHRYGGKDMVRIIDIIDKVHCHIF